MKVAILCDSPLLDRTLKIFLKEFVSPIANCDFVISDKPCEIHKPLFTVGNFEGSNLKKPFSRASLILQLERFYEGSFSRGEMGSYEELKERIADITEVYLRDIFKEIDRFASS